MCHERCRARKQYKGFICTCDVAWRLYHGILPVAHVSKVWRAVCVKTIFSVNFCNRGFLGNGWIFVATILRLRLFMKRRKLLKGTNLGFRVTTSYTAPYCDDISWSGWESSKVNLLENLRGRTLEGTDHVLYWLQAPSRQSRKVDLSTLPPDHEKSSQSCLTMSPPQNTFMAEFCRLINNRGRERDTSP